ncbi:hypothetical protein Dda_0742 [Drechslerella dactyloides]|uniref:Uncharacterized protein n=1 Tax=Drechslerella dactyloides TaxID=74499 RepID=A0AAD6NPA4_DREDA|nr:hypothetical protein Dda_0742 [Drechslerella dactyloides]
MKAPLALLGVSIASCYTSHKFYKQQQGQRSKSSLTASSPISEKPPHVPEAPLRSSSPSSPSQSQYPWWNPPAANMLAAVAVAIAAFNFHRYPCTPLQVAAFYITQFISMHPSRRHGTHWRQRIHGDFVRP